MIGRSLAKRMLFPQGQLNVISKRTMYPHVTSSGIISGMPENRIPVAEKVGFGIFLLVCVFGTPAWVLTHLDHYRHGQKVVVH